MADQGQDQDLVDIDPTDPGDGSLPVLRWKQAGRKELRALVTRLTLASAVLTQGKAASAEPASDNVIPFPKSTT